MPELSLSPEQKHHIIAQSRKWLLTAGQIWNREFADIPIHFDLRGKTSGMYVLRGHILKREQWIRYNPTIFAKHFEESCASTIPHEVAHYVCYEMHGRKPKPHGKEWRAIMQAFGVPAEATCKLDLSDIPHKRLKRFDYACNCSEHQLSSIRHNRIQRGQSRYICPKCRQPLIQPKKMGSE